MLIGYLVDGNFVCKTCLPKSADPKPIPVHAENIGQYKQSCSQCNVVVVKGIFDVELFPLVRGFGRREASKINAEMNAAIIADDAEAYESCQRKFYEQTLLAIMEDRLEDREYVFGILETIIE